ncbi:DUF2272 domain-containing protein [Acaryochloris sp. 'Moss Beach']|uniref:DUF2272 domain-containing protein n=1 Tax=Acaryochloris sp. 'Moss Beach' TaxID=2740837 RepID=UPI001F3FF9FA|nr:DUF2272 domain-containing protein [Acaryochloris sp. 'Moss Beach']
MFVDITALNFRSEPRVAAETRIGTVYLCQKLKNVREADVEGWVACVAEIDGSDREGFVSARYLRAPISENREKLVASVHREWMRFARGAGKEHHDPYYLYVGEMWQALGLNLDGTDRDTPWSAAAISFMVKNAGPAYSQFKFAAAHSKFIHHSINARITNDRSAPFWGYRLDEVQPELGDIICRDNPLHAPAVDFDVATSQDSYRSHTDVIMHIDSTNNRIVAIGGNVGHSVKIAEYDLTFGDFAAETRHTFALLKNIADS